MVFESNLLELFQTCNKCLAPSAPRVEKAVGSMIVIVSKCLKGHTKTWESQRCDGKLPWGNMLCAAGTLFTGSNPARVAAFFKHIEQLSLLQSLQGKAIALGGDGRCDSPGYSAKYGAYNLVELDLNKVLVVELVQVSITFLRLHFMQSTLIFVITVYAPVQSNHEK